jgi:hypothetical protein
MFGPRDEVLAKMRERTVAKRKRDAAAAETADTPIA